MNKELLEQQEKEIQSELSRLSGENNKALKENVSILYNFTSSLLEPDKSTENEREDLRKLALELGYTEDTEFKAWLEIQSLEGAIEPIGIKDKDNIDYVVEIIEGSVRKKGTDIHPRWSFRYSVENSEGEEVGFGSFSVSCLSEHQHLPDAEMFPIVMKIGASKVKDDIDNNEPIESKGYNTSVDDCFGLRFYPDGT